MSTDRPTLAATQREITGKHVARLRRAGQLPAVVFGHGVPSQSLSLDSHEFELLHRRIGQNVLVDLSVDGKKADSGAGPGRSSATRSIGGCSTSTCSRSG